MATTLAMIQNIVSMAIICLLFTLTFKQASGINENGVVDQKWRNSIEKRSARIENINYYDLEKIDVPCTCEAGRDVKVLGDDYFPPAIETTSCDIRLCPTPFGCKERLYNITVLKRKSLEESSEEDLPVDLKRQWIAVKVPIVLSCMCVRDY